jgi:hypothetical protein
MDLANSQSGDVNLEIEVRQVRPFTHDARRQREVWTVSNETETHRDKEQEKADWQYR